MLPAADGLTSTVGNDSSDAYTPTLQWNDIDSATGYTIVVYGPNGYYTPTYYTTTNANCDGVTCYVTHNVLTYMDANSGQGGPGTYTWTVLGNSLLGTGDAMTSYSSFTLSVLPAPAQLTSSFWLSSSGYTQTSGLDENYAYTPTLQWGAVSYTNAQDNSESYTVITTGYQFTVYGPSSSASYTVDSSSYTTYTSEWLAITYCNNTTGICSYTHTVMTNGAGLYTWTVRAKSDFYTGTTSSSQSFTLTLLDAPIDISTTVNNTDHAYTPVFRWDDIAYGEVSYSVTTSYQLQVFKQGTNVIDKTWGAAGSGASFSICTGGACAVTESVLSSGTGSYTWYVRAASALGNSDWSSSGQFEIELLPAPDTLTTTVGTTNVNAYTPVLIWDALDSAIGYTITVTGPSYSDTQWYTTNGANCNSYTCYVNQNILSGGGQAGTYTWTVTGRSGLGEGSSESSTFILSILPAPEYLTITVGTTGGTANPDTYTPVLQWSAVSYTDTAGNQSYTVITSGYDIEIYGPNGYTASYVTDADGYTHSTESLPITVCSGGSCSVTLSVLGTGGGAGQYTWQVRAESGIGDGEWTDFIPDDDHRFTLSVLSAPAPLSAVRVGYAYGEALFYTPNFQWGSIDNATGYTVVVEYPDASANSNWYTPGGANCSTTQSGQTCSVTVSVMEGGFGTYKWNVRGVDALGAGDWSGYSPPFIFTSLVAPTSLAETENDYTPTLSWRIAGTFTGEVNGYTVQVYGPDGTAVHSSAYTVAGYCESTAVGSLCTVTPSVLSGGPGTYTWSARAYNEVGAGAWATADDFVLTQLTGPTLQTPTFEGEGNSYTPTFHWTPSSSTTTSYTIQVIAPTGSSWAGYAVSVSAITAGCSGGTGTCSYTSSILLGGAGDYSWKVKAVDELGAGDWSTGTLTIDSIAAPSSLALTLDVTSDAVLYTPTFNWTGTSVATQYSVALYYPSGSYPSGYLTYNSLPYTVFAFTPSTANCVGGGTCSVSPSIMHGGDGTYSWWVQASDLAGVQSSWVSGGTTFTLNVYGSSPSQSYTLGTSSADAYTPTLNWTALSLATNYTVALWYPPLAAYDTYSYTPGQASCDSGELTCSVTPSILSRGEGTYNWYVQARSGLGESTWYGPDAFTLSLPTAPQTLTLTPGSGLADAYTPTMNWSTVDYATGYSVAIWYPTGSFPSGSVASGTRAYTILWYTSAEANCTNGTCSISPSVMAGGDGTYNWYIKTKTALGESATWATGDAFTFGPPSGPSTITPTTGNSDVTTYTVYFEWDKSTSASLSGYTVIVTNPAGSYVTDPSGDLDRGQWYPLSSSLCPANTCSVTYTIGLTGGTGTYKVWIAAQDGLGISDYTDETFTISATDGPVQLSPSTALLDGYTPTYQWSSVSNANYYYVRVYNSAITQSYLESGWLTYTETNCVTGGTCSYIHPNASALPAGTYVWWVQSANNREINGTWQGLGAGGWSDTITTTTDVDGMSFNVTVSASTLIIPTGTLGTYEFYPTYQWNTVPVVDWYVLEVTDPNSTISYYSYQPSVACSGGICTVTTSTANYQNTALPALSEGTYSWRVLTWNNTLNNSVTSTYGWSSSSTFTISSSTPAEPVPILPARNATVAGGQPTYRWTHSGGTTYHLYWYKNGAYFYDQWFTAADYCSGSTCEFTQAGEWGNSLSAGEYWLYIRAYNPNGYWEDPAHISSSDPLYSYREWSDLDDKFLFTVP
ncbi:hypothetical protein GMMP1_370043 [Candidatus Magnetomoraceae bacterium gMMP-1]